MDGSPGDRPVRLRLVKRRVVALLLAALAACGSGDDTDGAASVVAPASTVSTGAEPQPTPPSSTAGPTTAEEPATSPAAVPTTQPPTAQPATTQPATTRPPPSATTTAPPSKPTSGTAVVYASSGDEHPWLPVGWWDGAAWGSVEWPTPEVVIPGSTFDTLSVASVEFPTGPMRDVPVVPASYGCIDDAGLASIDLQIGLTEAPDWHGYRLLAVTADWDVQPRPVSQVGVDSPVYKQLGESLVPADQPVDPALGEVVQVLRADLDGNGVEEVLFTYQHLTDSGGMGAPGEFSLVIARYPDATGAVVDDVLVEHVVPTPMDAPSPDRSRVMAIADLNGDGTMEVAIGSVYWESAAVVVYEFTGGALHEVMTSGCGV